jgi:hypothetical protein
MRNCHVRRTASVGSVVLEPRRNGAADTAMGATATANKDTMERRMLYGLSKPNKKVFVNFVAKKWIVRKDVKKRPGPVSEMEVDSVYGLLLS